MNGKASMIGRGLSLVCGALLCAGGAFAAGDKLVLPLGPVMDQAETKTMLAGTVVRFGVAAGQAPAAIGSEVRAMSWARPFDTRGYGGRGMQLPDGRPERLSKEQMCQLALRYALSNLIDETKQRGGQAVLDVVSNNDNVELNSTTSFECMLATSSSTVNLKGRAAAAVQAQK